MALHPFVIADIERVAVLSALPRIHGLFQSANSFRDEQGVSWRSVPIANSAVGISVLGPGWVWDAAARTRSSKTYASKFSRARNATADQVDTQFADVFGKLRAGSLAERMLWVMHQQVLGLRSSHLIVPDLWLAEQVWGQDYGRPHGWRQVVAAILEGLSWLHIADRPEGNENPHFCDETALLIRVRDFRSKPEDRCHELCPMRGGAPHSHFLVDTGPGFLGILEACGEANEQGAREYRFPTAAKKGRSDFASLRKLGKKGRLVSVYLPARLGDPEKCRSFSSRQRTLFQAMVRELSRTPAKKRQSGSPFDTFIGNRIPVFNGPGFVVCEKLDPHATHVGFNGNGTRRGLGYRLSSEGGWLARSGYQPQRECATFVRDLGRLARLLGLTAVGIQRGNQVVSLSEIQALVSTCHWRQVDELHLRIYARADFVETWNRYFEVDAPVQTHEPRADELLTAVQQLINKRGLTSGDVADQLEIDRSFFSKVMRRRKLAPPAMIAKLKSWLTTVSEPKAALPDEQQERSVALQTDLLSMASEYLQRGWCVLPQEPGLKKAHVKWKPYQSRLPTLAEWKIWSKKWPDAGLLLVLGPVSGVCAIDVDGQEAYDALLEHLGEEPRAPKVISGSGEPNKFHLYFQHPDVSTRPKMTPWHPKLEFRGHKGLIIMPPSLHRSGNRYQWVEGQSLADLPLPALPEAIVEAIIQVNNAKTKARVADGCTKNSGQSLTTIASLAGVTVSPRTSRFLSGADADGSNWNDKLFQAACDLCGRGVPLSKAQPALLKGARPHTDADRHQAQLTIASAYSKPREPGKC